MIDLHLVVGLAVAAVFSILVSAVSITQRSWYLSVIALIGAALYHWHAFAGFLIVNGIAYTVVCRLNGAPSARWRRACVAMLALIAVFTLGRVFRWDNWMVLKTPAPMALYSLDMWLALRLVTLFWEVGSGSAAPSLPRFILWTCLPFTLSGPLVRYSQLPAEVCPNRSLWTSAAWWLQLGAAAVKLVLGSFLGVGQHVIIYRWPQVRLWNNLATALFTGPVGFYLTTAGYFELMEVLARPAGVNVPESFNSPLGRENISAFWSNWNMTATGVFRDYVFYNRWGLPGYNVYVNTMILFALVGLWHAADAYWLLFGFLHGLLFCGFLLWRKYRTRIGHFPFRGTLASRTAARGFTYLCICASWYLPSKILQKIGMLST